MLLSCRKFWDGAIAHWAATDSYTAHGVCMLASPVLLTLPPLPSPCSLFLSHTFLFLKYPILFSPSGPSSKPGNLLLSFVVLTHYPSGLISNITSSGKDSWHPSDWIQSRHTPICGPSLQLQSLQSPKSRPGMARREMFCKLC